MVSKNRQLLNFLNSNIGRVINIWTSGFQFDVKIEKAEMKDGNIVLNDMFKFNVCLYENSDWTSKYFACSNCDDDMNEIDVLEIELLD